MTRLSFRNLKTDQDIEKWLQQLNNDWPERVTIVEHITQQIQHWQQVNLTQASALTVLELCPGAGQLAVALWQALPQMTYLGIDGSSLLVHYARQQPNPLADRAKFVVANLNQDDWLEQLPPTIHAIVSMQSLHDLGGESEVDRIYWLAKSLLVPGGLFLNADLIVSPGEDLPNNPGRRSIPRHLALLQSHSYEQVACSLQVGGFGCVVGIA